MRTLKFQMLSSVLLALVTVTVSASSVWAEAPAETPRYFAERTDPTLPSADWEAEESKRMVAHRDGGHVDVIEFITPDLNGPWRDEDAIVLDAEGKEIFDLRSTRWVRTPVLHITEFGAEEIRDVYWLEEDMDGDGDLDPAAPGMTAPTGLDGVVTNVVTIRIAFTGSSDSQPNKFYITPLGNLKFHIAAGMFQK